MLEILQTISYSENFYCYYLHSKGVSKLNQRGRINPIKSWRNYMEYFIIDKYNNCIVELNSGVDAVGVKLRPTPKGNPNNTLMFWWGKSNISPIPKHFSGNFWWSKSDYIKKLPDIKILSKYDRHEAEFWIGYMNGNLKSLHDSKEAGYTTIITENYKF